MTYSTLKPSTKPSTKPMKRTAFKVKPLAGLLRTANLASPLKWPTLPKPRKSRMKSKQRVILDVPAVFRSEAYLAAVRTLPCVCCGRQNHTQAAHSNQLRFGKAKSMKASDATAMALCASTPGSYGCHALHDQGGKLLKAEVWEFEYKHICSTVLRLIRAGVLDGEPELVDSIPHPLVVGHESLAIALIAHIESGRLWVAR
jgi:hypothetical protein